MYVIGTFTLLFARAIDANCVDSASSVVTCVTRITPTCTEFANGTGTFAGYRFRFGPHVGTGVFAHFRTPTEVRASRFLSFSAGGASPNNVTLVDVEYESRFIRDDANGVTWTNLSLTLPGFPGGVRESGFDCDRFVIGSVCCSPIATPSSADFVDSCEALQSRLPRNATFQIVARQATNSSTMMCQAVTNRDLSTVDSARSILTSAFGADSFDVGWRFEENEPPTILVLAVALVPLGSYFCACRQISKSESGAKIVFRSKRLRCGLFLVVLSAGIQTALVLLGVSSFAVNRREGNFFSNIAIFVPMTSLATFFLFWLKLQFMVDVMARDADLDDEDDRDPEQRALDHGRCCTSWSGRKWCDCIAMQVFGFGSLAITAMLPFGNNTEYDIVNNSFGATQQRFDYLYPFATYSIVCVIALLVLVCLAALLSCLALCKGQEAHAKCFKSIALIPVIGGIAALATMWTVLRAQDIIDIVERVIQFGWPAIDIRFWISFGLLQGLALLDIGLAVCASCGWCCFRVLARGALASAANSADKSMRFEYNYEIRQEEIDDAVEMVDAVGEQMCNDASEYDEFSTTDDNEK